MHVCVCQISCPAKCKMECKTECQKEFEMNAKLTVRSKLNYCHINAIIYVRFGMPDRMKDNMINMSEYSICIPVSISTTEC